MLYAFYKFPIKLGIMNSRKQERVYNSFDFGNPNVIVEDVAYLYQSIYEGSNKKDQDLDGDKDLMIARMIASGVPKDEAIRRVRNKSYNEAYVPFKGKPSEKLRKKQGALADRWDEPGVEDRFHNLGKVYSTLTNPYTAAYIEQQNRDRDAATARRKAYLKNEFELWVDTLLDEGYDLSDYTWDELYDEYLDEAGGNPGGAINQQASLERAAREKKEAPNRARNQRIQPILISSWAQQQLNQNSPYAPASTPTGMGAIVRDMLTKPTSPASFLSSARGSAPTGNTQSSTTKPPVQRPIPNYAAAAKAYPAGSPENRTNNYYSNVSSRKYGPNTIMATNTKGVQQDVTVNKRYSGGKAGDFVYDAQGARKVVPKQEEFELWVDTLLDEGYDLSDYTWDEIYDIYEETELERRKREEHEKNERRARVAELTAQGRVMTSSRRTSTRAKQRKREQRQDELERAAQAALNSIRGATGRVSERPMGSEPPAPRPAAPGSDRGDVRVLPTGLKKDNLGSAADRIIRSVQSGGKKKKPSLDDLLADIKKEEGFEYELYNSVAEYLLDEGYVDDYESAEMMMENMSDEWLGEIFESKKWIQKAIKKPIKKPGALSKQLGVPEEKNIPLNKLRRAAKKGGKLGKRARLAMTLRRFH
jgi:hypothetical protein